MSYPFIYYLWCDLGKKPEHINNYARTDHYFEFLKKREPDRLILKKMKTGTSQFPIIKGKYYQ